MLYLVMGILFNVIMSGMVVNMYKLFGYLNVEIIIVLGSIGVVWLLKLLWVVFFDMYCMKKFFVLMMELVFVVFFVVVVMLILMSGFF